MSTATAERRFNVNDPEDVKRTMESLARDVVEREAAQLSFEVGGDAEGERLIGSLTISGSIPVTENLDLGDEIQVRIVTADGEVMATVAAVIGAPNFKTHRDKYGLIVAIERAHKAKVIDS